MKNWILLALCLSVLTLAAQTSFRPTFTLAEPAIVGGGAQLRFEVQLSADVAGHYHARGQVYLTYNTDAFGDAAASAAIVQPLTLLNELNGAGEPKYRIISTVDNRAGVLAITWESMNMDQSPSGLSHTEVPTTPTGLFEVVLSILDPAEQAGIAFDADLMTPQQYSMAAAGGSTACLTPYGFENGVLPTVLLPLDLLTFRASPQEKSIQLDWTSAQEVDFAGYELQRATDGRNFRKLAWIAGQGQESNTYGYEDREVQLGPTYSYRLEMHDLDGTRTYSEVRTAALRLPEGIASLSIQPNPAREKFYTSFTLDTPAQMTLVLYQANGQQVYQQHYTLTAGSNQLMVNTAAYPAGLYTVVVRVGSQEWSQQLVIER